MDGLVSNSNNVNHNPPENLSDLVCFVETVIANPSRVFAQISGYGVEVVRELAVHYGTNFFPFEENKSDLNPFTIIYINADNEVKSTSIDERSKIIIYAIRPVSNYR
jgi:DNA-directed RNA polymerase alpha subunit